jgi:hypothetical protein
MSKRPTTPKPAFPAIAPLQDAFEACTCGILVLVRIWTMGKGTEPGYWTPCAPMSPFYGKTHACQTQQEAA